MTDFGFFEYGYDAYGTDYGTDFATIGGDPFATDYGTGDPWVTTIGGDDLAPDFTIVPPDSIAPDFTIVSPDGTPTDLAPSITVIGPSGPGTMNDSLITLYEQAIAQGDLQSAATVLDIMRTQQDMARNWLQD
jgi:hypothetical protein